MEFGDAARILGAQITTRDIANALGIGLHTARQARQRPGPKGTGYRRPPAGWERTLATLARARIVQLEELVRQLERQADGRPGKK